MNPAHITRRTFLKIMGVTGSGVFVTLPGCDSQVSLEEGKEIVTSYLDPEEFVIPGDEVWYASTCLQCPAGCGIHARVREGRVRKLEGNPDSPINQGALCARGQAGLQHHYNPDRVAVPLARHNGRLTEVSWGVARQQLADYLGQSERREGEGFALLTGGISGHLGVLMTDFVRTIGGHHYCYEPLSGAIGRTANTQVLGAACPALHLDKARLVVSFGADFLGTWQSPVHFGAQYGRFRDPPRGSLIQIEPKMTVTGANADWWRAIRPGTEGWLMLGLAQRLATQPDLGARLPKDVRESLARYDMETVSRITDIPADQIERLVKALTRYRPSLVLVGASAEGQANGTINVMAGLLLNHLLGNIGETLTFGDEPSHSELAGEHGSTAALHELAEALPSIDTLFIYGANPLYTAPGFVGFEEKFNQVATRVSFATQRDETTMAADLVIPVRSYLEDWGTHMPIYLANGGLVHVQQPVMEPLYSPLPGMGDLVLEFLKQLDASYSQWDDFYTYLRASVTGLRTEAERAGFKPYSLPEMLEPPVLKPDSPEQMLPPNELDRLFWEAVVAQGLLSLPSRQSPSRVTLQPLALAEPEENSDYPFHLIPSPQPGLYDGRHANLPWLQELPDPLTKIVWDSWAEIHPETAVRLDISEGDVVEIASAHGSLQVKAVLFAGIHPAAVGVPLGQGHTVGRYASGVGVNPFKILSPRFERETGELAVYATRISLRNTGRSEPVVKQGRTDYQHGRRLVRTVDANPV